MTATDQRRAESSVAGPDDPVSVGWERMLATGALVTLGWHVSVVSDITIGLIYAVLVAPLWIKAFAQFRLGRLVAGLIVGAIFWGYYLASLHSDTHQIDSSHARVTTLQLVLAVCGIGVVLWARTVMSVARIGMCFGAGLLADTVLHPVATTNAWKFVYAVPVTIFVIGLALRRGRNVPAICALVALAAVSVVLDCRAYSSALLLAALLTVWRSLPSTHRLRRPWGWTALMIGAVSLAMYLLGSSLLVNGYLGAAAQERSIAQIRESGSLILGGRPEASATMALMAHDPGGFGVGVVPSPQDVLVAKSGLQSINYAPNNGYVEHYMFGGQIELHSMVGDLWANWGVFGIALALGLALLALRALASSIAHRAGDALTVFVCCWSLWNIAFSPLQASLAVAILTAGLCLRPRTAVTAFGGIAAD